MGCELCKNDNRDNIDLRFSRDENITPIEVNTKFGDYNLDKESYISNLEGKLNDKYSIPIKTLDEKKDQKLTNKNTLNTPREELNNKNKNEYIINTLNIYSNNTIQFSSRNKNKNEENKATENEINNNAKENNEKENIFESTSNIKK